jgi:hypothetical protein
VHVIETPPEPTPTEPEPDPDDEGGEDSEPSE